MTSESRFPLLLARLLLGLALRRARDLEPAKDAGDVIELPAAVRARRYLRLLCERGPFWRIIAERRSGRLAGATTPASAS